MSPRQPIQPRTRRRERPERRSARLRPGQLATAGARRGAGTQDRALYACPCGETFTAEVTTSVGCPRCGAGQAW